MRAMRDSRLPEPYRSWIDKVQPLSSRVHLLPRAVSVWYDLTIFVLLGGMFIGMDVLLITLFWRPIIIYEGMGPILILAGFFFLLALVPYFLLRRLVITIGAHRDLERGMLRQGIIVGVEGVLIRLEPNRCYVIPIDRFVNAKIVVRGGIGEDEPPQKAYFFIETLDGPLDFFEERINASPDQLNKCVKGLRK